MAHTITNPARNRMADASVDAPFLLYERLDCYRLAVQFQSVEQLRSRNPWIRADRDMPCRLPR